ncbi:MAG: Ig-like domain-containing protein, partial [Sulfurospirillaceae bacterium]|nr:Ig-like domain-containing protein [Sulfurospirillaceae bacterium]
GQDVTVEVTDKAGNSGSDTDEVPGSVTDFTDTTAPDAPEITNIIDHSGNLNEMVMYGTGEPGSTIDLYYYDESIFSTVTDENGNWSIDLTSFVNPEEVNSYWRHLHAKATDEAGNESDSSNYVTLAYTKLAQQILYGDKPYDYYAFNSGDKDARMILQEHRGFTGDKLVVDAGNGTDILVIRTAFEDFKITGEGSIVFIEDIRIDKKYDKIELRNFERIEFSDGVYDIEEDTFYANPPIIAIDEVIITDTNDPADGEADKAQITGETDQPNTTVTIKDKNGNIIGEGTTDNEGKFDITIDTDAVQSGEDVTAEVSNKYNVSASDTKPAGDVVFTDTTAPDTPLITDIVDETGDYSKVTMHGTGEVGATIMLYAREGSTIDGNQTNEGEYVVAATAIVGEDGKWSIDISDLETTPVNDNESFYVTATDKAGNVSEPSETIHYYHGTFTNALTESEDDFVMLGDGDDRVTINADDANDKLVIDGGIGQDRAVFKGAFDEYDIAKDGNKVFVKDIAGGTNDLVELRNFEKIEFSDGVYDIENEDFDPSSASLIIEPVYKDGEGSFKEGESITLKATLSVAAKSDMTITLDNGEEIEIKKGDTEGFVTFENPNEEDVYIDAETLEYSLEVSGGFNENTNIEKPSSIKVEITDTVDTTKVTLTPTIHTAVEKDIVINVDSINQEGSGFKVTALDHEGNSAEVVVNGSPIGFGILSNNQKIGDKDNTGYSGAPVEIGVINTGTSLKPVYESEKLIIEFDNEISSLNIGLAWLNKSTSITEKAKIKFYGTNGEEYEVILDGATDANGFVEQSFKDLEFSVSKIEFTAVGKDSDFLVNKIEFTEIVSEEVNTLIPGQESTIVYEIKTEHKPDASKFTFEGNDFPTATVEVNGKEYTVNLNKEGVGKLEIEHDGQTELNAKVTAVNGNFEKVDLDEAVSSLEAVATQVHLTDMQVVSSVYYEDIENVVTEVWKDWKDAMFAVSNETTNTNNELTGNSEIAFKIGGNGTITKTSNLTIKPIDGSNIPTLFEVGDVYEVSWKESKTPYKVQMTVTRSDSKSVSGEPMDIVILTGVVNGKETAVIIDSTNIGTNTNYFKNDLWDSTVGDANDYVGYIDYTVSGTSYANAEISIKSIVDGDEKEIGNAIADVNGHWSADLKELTGKSGTLKIESTDEHGNTTEDVKSYLFGESGNDVLIGSDGDDFIYGGAGADELYGEDGDDTLVTDLNTDSTAPSGDTVLDGGSGFDTLVLEENNSIDFSKLGDYAEIKNIEVIDLTKGDHKLDNLSIKDVFDMTDDKNELIILGDEKDSISPLDGDIWANKGTVTQSVNGTLHTLEVYETTFDNDKTVTVKIEEEIVIL